MDVGLFEVDRFKTTGSVSIQVVSTDSYYWVVY